MGQGLCLEQGQPPQRHSAAALRAGPWAQPFPLAYPSPSVLRSRVPWGLWWHSSLRPETTRCLTSLLKARY